MVANPQVTRVNVSNPGRLYIDDRNGTRATQSGVGGQNRGPYVGDRNGISATQAGISEGFGGLSLSPNIGDQNVILMNPSDV
jgi:hypothetical protein